jgi:hypothetical protein
MGCHTLVDMGEITARRQHAFVITSLLDTETANPPIVVRITAGRAKCVVAMAAAKIAIVLPGDKKLHVTIWIFLKSQLHVVLSAEITMEAGLPSSYNTPARRADLNSRQVRDFRQGSEINQTREFRQPREARVAERAQQIERNIRSESRPNKKGKGKNNENLDENGRVRGYR